MCSLEGIHHKPIGLLNINSFYDPLLAMIDKVPIHITIEKKK